VSSALADEGREPVTQAGSVSKQTSTVNFAADQTVASDHWYSVMVNGHDYSVAVGSNASIWINTAQTVGVEVKEWSSPTTLTTIVSGTSSATLGTASVTPDVRCFGSNVCYCG
jgi:hypothetical protein